jgi:hypothetical protein
MEIVIAGGRDHPVTDAMLRVVRARFLPNKVVALADPDDAGAASLFPLVHAHKPRAGNPAAYVCENFACREPTTDPERLAALIQGLSS